MPARPDAPSVGFRLLAWTVRQALGPGYRRFLRALERPEESQDALLARLVGSLAATAYGRSHGLSPRAGYAEFARALPVVRYAALMPWLDRQRNGERAVLTPDPVLFHERTSGSTGATKAIPYTRPLLGSFQHLFRVWLADLLESGPRFATGRTFLVVSPSLTLEKMAGAPDTDVDYLHGWMRAVLRHFVVAPPEAARLGDPEALLTAHSLALLAAHDLEIISVWSPTFFLRLLDFIAARRADLLARLGARDARDRERLRILERDPIEWGALWPRLALVSCWADGASAEPARRLASLFPRAWLQPKSLLATEAPITVPLVRPGVAVPLVDEVFLEFEEEEGAAVRRLHEVREGETYTLVVTQKGGLARYRLGDRVRVGPAVGRTPSLLFVGPDEAISDLVGEKLEESFVEAVLAQLPLGEVRFRALAPCRRADGRAQYVLLAEGPEPADDALGQRLDLLLCGSFRYREARALGQLEAAEVRLGSSYESRYLEHVAARGGRPGVAKLRALLPDAAAQALLGEGP